MVPGSTLAADEALLALGVPPRPSQALQSQTQSGYCNSPDESGQIWQSSTFWHYCLGYFGEGYVSNKILRGASLMRHGTARRSQAIPGCVQPCLAISGCVWLRAQPQHQTG